MDLNDEAILKWGRLFSAEVVVYGKCEIMGDNLVLVNLKSYDTENGNLIYTGIQAELIKKDTDVPDHLTESIQNVIGKIAANLGPETIKAVEAGEVGLNKIEVELSGLKSFDQFRRFRSFLTEEIQGVDSVIQSRIRPNSITVQVEYNGRKDGLFEKMLTHGSFPFLADISSVDDDKILIKIK